MRCAAMSQPRRRTQGRWSIDPTGCFAVSEQSASNDGKRTMNLAKHAATRFRERIFEGDNPVPCPQSVMPNRRSVLILSNTLSHPAYALSYRSHHGKYPAIYATSLTTPPAALIFSSASLEMNRVLTMNGWLIRPFPSCGQSVQVQTQAKSIHPTHQLELAELLQVDDGNGTGRSLNLRLWQRNELHESVPSNQFPNPPCQC